MTDELIRNKSVKFDLINSEPRYISYLINLFAPIITFLTLFLTGIILGQIPETTFFIVAILFPIILIYNYFRKKYDVIGNVTFGNHTITTDLNSVIETIDLNTIEAINFQYQGFETELRRTYWYSKEQQQEGTNNKLFFYSKIQRNEPILVVDLFISGQLKRNILLNYLDFYRKEYLIKISTTANSA